MRNSQPPEILEPSNGDILGGMRDIAAATELSSSFEEDGITVNAAITDYSLSKIETSPVVDPIIEGLGDIALRTIRYTGGKHYDQPVRTHKLYTIELNGYRHATEITDPGEGDPEFTIVSLPGFTECIEGPFRKDMQSHMSNEFPNARIVSIGSNGIGMTGDRYGWNERSLHGLNAMASQRLSIAKALSGKNPVLFAGTSMGTVITERALYENAFDNPVNGQVNVIGQFLLSAALVDPKNALQVMGLKFIPEMVADTTKELALKTNPLEIPAFLAKTLRYGLSKKDLQAMGNQIVDLLQGTDEELIADVVSVTPTIMLAGQKDCLAQWKMWERLRGAFPDKVYYEPVKGRGHSLGMKPEKACEKMRRTLQNLPILPTSDNYNLQHFAEAA